MAGAYEPEFFEEAGVPIDGAADEALKWAIIGCVWLGSTCIFWLGLLDWAEQVKLDG
jgi:hypothetical protein